jgi:hypothetical protein
MADETKLFAKALIGDEAPKYWEALGRFVATFALVEQNMQMTLWQVVGVKPPTAQAIFSGTRVKPASDYITRIAEAKKWTIDEREIIKDVLSHLGEISRVRNDILHYGATQSISDEWIVTNKTEAHIASKIRTTRISITNIDQMIADLDKIIFHLIAIAERGRTKPFPPAFDAVLKHAWQYKSSQPAKTSVRPPSKPRKPPRQPPA